MRIGIGIGEISNDRPGIDNLVSQAEQAERDGFASGWFANIFGVDAITAAALCGRATTDLELCTAVVPTYPRHPFAMAQQAMTAQAACEGRFTLGIGLSHQMVIEMMFGLSYAKSYSHMRDYLAVLEPLIRNGSVSHSGSEFRVNANLTVPGASPCPILVAALAPKMLALAGSVADGTVTWMTGPKTVRDHIIPSIQKAAADAGRPQPRVVVGLPVAVTSDVKAGREAASRIFQVYGGLPSYRAMLDREGAEGPSDVAIVGDETAVSQQIAALRDIGATDFLASPFPVGPDASSSIELTRLTLMKALKH